MKKIILLIFLLSLKNYGQTITRSFSLNNSTNNFSMGTSAPIVQTQDNGYLLNYSYSYPNWDVAPGYQSTIIKTDINFIPLWSKKLNGGNGKKTILFNDGSSLFFSDSGSLVKLDSNGLTLFSIGNFTTYPEKLFISDVELIGTIIKVIGSKDTYNGFGFITSSIPLILDLDINGNVLQTYILSDSTTSYPRPLNILKDNFGNYYLTSYSYNNGNYISKISSTNTVLWSKRYKHSNDLNIISVNDITSLSNGDILLAGSFYNYSTSLGSIFLQRLSSSTGNQISAKTSTIYSSGINNIDQLSSGDLIATGWLRESDTSFNRTFSMKMNSNEVFSWLKLYNEGFAISAPLIKNNNNWYYSAFHNNNENNNNPILFNTENTGITNCSYNDIFLTFNDIPLVTNPSTLTLTTSPTLLQVPTTVFSYPTEIQTYVDACIQTLSINEIDKTSYLTVSPNPSKGDINIVSESIIKSINVTNSLGQKVNDYFPNAFETKLSIDSNGLYIVRIETEKEIKTTKIIISN